MIDFIMLPIPPPQELPMKRFVSLFVVVVLSFSICTFAFALEDLPEFDSDFMRYAPSSGSVVVGSDTKSIVVPWSVVTSTIAPKAVSSLDVRCDAIGNLHGHFTFVLIVGCSSVPSVVSTSKPVSIETIDSQTNLHYYSSRLRPTNYRFEYKQYFTDTNYKSFLCVPFIVEFDIPDDETLTEIYSDNSQTFITVTGDYTTAAFFLYSYSKNSEIEHMSAIEDYISVLPDYVEYVENAFSDVINLQSYTYDTLYRFYSLFSNFPSRYNSQVSRDATWDNMPYTTSPFNALADIIHAVTTEKARQASQEKELQDLKYLQQEMISTTSEKTYTFYQGITNIFGFFDVSSSEPFDITDSFLGYEDYFGNVPFFFSSDIESRLEVQNAG